MSRIRNIVAFIVLAALFIIYCWVLKNKPLRTESLIFKETKMIPDLTFSKLADLENRMVVELDDISNNEFNNNQNEEVTSDPMREYGLIQIVAFISLSLSGVLVVLFVTRRFYLQDDFEADLERIPSISVLNSQEKLIMSYQTEQN